MLESGRGFWRPLPPDSMCARSSRSGKSSISNSRKEIPVFSLKKMRLAALSLVAASSVVMLAGTSALAAEPGEAGSWNAEVLSNGAQLQTMGPLGEARNWDDPEFLVRVWRSNDSQNTLWGSIGENDTPGTAIQMNAPRQPIGYPVVVAFGTTSFMIFYTGTDHHIYQAQFSPLVPGTRMDNLQWFDSGLTSDASPHAVQLGAAQRTVGVTWRANDASHNVWYAQYSDLEFQQGYRDFANLGGNAAGAPTVAYDPQTQEILAAHTGTDAHVYLTERPRNQGGQFGAWRNVGGVSVGSPSIVSSPTGTTALATRAPDATVWYMRVDQGLAPLENWQQDITHAQSPWDVNLTLNDSGDIYALLTGVDNNNTYWKKVMNGS